MADVTPPLQKDLAAALGVTPAVITRDKAAGMPVHSVEAAQRWRLEHKRARVRTFDSAPPAGAAPGGSAAAHGASGGMGEGAYGQPPDENRDHYAAARTRREQAEAELAELKLAEQRGELIRRDVMERVVGSRASATREAVLQVTSRIAPLLAAEMDPAKVRAMLDAELRQALDQSAQAA